MTNYGETLKEHRLVRGKTLDEVAKYAGTSKQNLSRWERNEVLPNIDFCVKLADYYEITLDELIGRDIGYKTNITNSQTITVHGGNVEISQNNK